MKSIISKHTLQRLPSYLTYLKSLSDTTANVSATTIADALGLNQVQVRKDLAAVSDGGRPKLGYIKEELIHDIQIFLGYDNSHSAILVGAGKLGGALLSYQGFKEYGLNILAAFDENENIINTEIGGKTIYPISKIKELCNKTKVNIAIVTVPAFAAQKTCDLLVECGIHAIWNFAPVHIKVPKGILIQQENMAASLAVLSNKLDSAVKEKEI